MNTHVKALAWLQIIYGGFMILLGTVALLFFGGLAAFVGMVDRSGDAAIAVPILGAIGGIAFFLIFLISLPRLIAGVGLLNFRPWARILTIILCVLGLWEFPIGTAIGVYGLWVCLSQEGTALFNRA